MIIQNNSGRCYKMYNNILIRLQSADKKGTRSYMLGICVKFSRALPFLFYLDEPFKHTVTS